MSRVVIEVDECSKNIRSFGSKREHVFNPTFLGPEAGISASLFIKNDKHACKSREMCKFANLKMEKD